MIDLIDRQEAITIPILPKEHREYQTMNLDDAYELGWFDYQKCIEDLPTVEPKKGKWLQNKDDSAGCGYFICSECKKDFYDAWNYCPNCGSPMEGEKNERD